MPVYEDPMRIQISRFASVVALVFGLVACGSSPSSQESASALYGEQAAYPNGPRLDVTPGALCQHADQYRYPDHIAYCERDVDSGLKKDIIAQYDRDFGNHIGDMNRGDFKIDHFIPLCIGGANDRANLWPQHKSVYVLTDRIEEQLGELMARGKLHQDEAVKIIRGVKLDLSTAQEVQADLNRRLGH
jgi:hypothetical protein